MTTGKRSIVIIGSCAIAMAVTSLALEGRAQNPLGASHFTADDGAVRRELAADYERFSEAVHHKDAAALAAFVRSTTTPDLQIKGPNGSPLAFLDMNVPQSERRGLDQLLTQALLLKDFPAAAREFGAYTVESATIHIDKLVVFGDTALALNSGQGMGVLNDMEARSDPSHEKHWLSFKYRDCETWTRIGGVWKLREVYLLAYVPDYWRLHRPQDKSPRPSLGF